MNEKFTITEINRVILVDKNEYKEKVTNPYIAASRGYVDDVIEPNSTRQRLVSALEMLMSKRESGPAKKHGNMPL